jgi:2-polyprenyl-6-methoxyphenol hydroxylase-like FAD-dependent oxidoreductase
MQQSPVALGEAFRECYGYSYAVMHRSDLHAHLLQACCDNLAVTLETGRIIVDIADRGDTARATCADGFVYEAGLLVGADGLHSPARRALEDDAPPVCQEYVTFRGTVPTERMTKAAGLDSMVRNAAFQRCDPADYRSFDWLYGGDPVHPDAADDARGVAWLPRLDGARNTRAIPGVRSA